MAPTTKDRTTEGPAASEDASAVRINRPAPMIAPMPRATRLFAVKVRLRWLSWACASSTVNDFLRVRLIRFLSNLSECCAGGRTMCRKLALPPDHLFHHAQEISAHDL